MIPSLAVSGGLLVALLSALVQADYGIKDTVTPNGLMKNFKLKMNNGASNLDYSFDIVMNEYDFQPSQAQPLGGCNSDFDNDACGYNNGAREPNQGHYHLYLGRRDDSSEFFETVGFGGASATTGVGGNLCGLACAMKRNRLEQGNYVFLLELEHNDHTRRTKFAPRDFPPIDAQTFSLDESVECECPSRRLGQTNYDIKDDTTPKGVMKDFELNTNNLDYSFDIVMNEEYDFDPFQAQPLVGCGESGFEVTRTCGYNNGKRVSNQGHYHLYLGRRDDSTEFFETVGFGGASATTGVQGNLCGLACAMKRNSVDNGEYMFLLELENHDHTRRVKFAPRDFPPIDIQTFRLNQSTDCDCV